ncbi:MAG: hypothetical protein HXX13_09725 [Bacteroidetes bacterium]|nr:hypothetical protein [Bacteroidota bacterium]
MKKVYILILLLSVILCNSKLQAQEKNYKEGSTWSVSFVKANANMGKDYLNSLKGTWKAVHDEAVKEGIIVSYKILSGMASNPEDWDIMLMVEYKSLASIEGNDDKWDAIYKNIVGNDESMKKLNETRANMRSIYGGKLLREIIYK